MSKHTNAFGNVVIVTHLRGISTVYAHNHQNIVRVGETVKKGQIIALSGNSGDSTGPHLHFEVRQNDKAIEPISFLKNQGKNLK
jgi:murein DD-endopeptidase MepM/ murein hydrolase activator NlpD